MTIPNRIDIEDQRGIMENLRKYVKSGHVKAQALVYVNANGGAGVETFIKDTHGELIRGEHYVENRAVTRALRAYTGSVWLSANAPKEVLLEILPFLLERDSIPSYDSKGVMHIYNNPLFRAVVALGCWGKTNEEYFETNTFPNNRRSVMTNILLRKKKVLEDKREELEKQASEATRLRDAMRRGGFKESAKDYSKQLSSIRKKLGTLKASLEFVKAAEGWLD